VRLISQLNPQLTTHFFASGRELAWSPKKLGFRRVPGRGIFKNYDRPESLGPAAFYNERRLDYPFDSRSHECARPKPKPCGSARPPGGRTERHYHKVLEELYFISKAWAR